MSKKLPGKVSKAVGRPTKLTNKILTKTRDIMAAGSSQNVAIKELGISRDTFYKWKRESPEFSAMLADGKVWGEAVHEETIKNIAQGNIKNASVAAYQMYMRNVYGWDKGMGEGNSHTNINIGQMNVLQDKSTDELREYILDLADETSKIIDVDFEETSSEA